MLHRALLETTLNNGPASAIDAAEFYLSKRDEALAATRSAAEIDELGPKTAEHHDQAAKAHDVAGQAAANAGNDPARSAHADVAHAHRAASRAADAHGEDDGVAAWNSYQAAHALERGDFEATTGAAETAESAASAALDRFRAL